MPRLSVSLDTKTSSDFRTLPARLREAAEAGLRREITKAVTRTLRPIETDVRRSAVRTLPRRGGLGAEVSRSRITRSQRSTGDVVTVEISASHRYDIAAMNKGRVNHPLYGNRRHWYSQRVRPRWWSDPTRRSGPRVRAALNDAMTTVARDIDR